MRDRNAYENSSVWNMVSEIKQDEYINSLSPGMRNYLMYLLEDIERRKNTNCYYVSESTLNTLNNDLGYIRDYLSSSSLESYIDRAFEHLASSWPAHNGRRVVDIAQSTYNHYVDEAEKRIKEIRDQADKIDSLKDEFDDFLESTKNEIVETKEVMEKRTDEIEEATNARHKEMGEQYEDFLVSAKENAEKSIEQITESYLKFYNDLFGLDLVLDNDGNMILTEGLVLQDEKIWKKFLGKDIIPKSNSCELYFEERDIEAFVEKLERSYPSIQYANKLMTHSWGQKVVRFYDLDGNLIEVGTPM